MELFICDITKTDIEESFTEHLEKLPKEKQEYILKSKQLKGQQLRLARELLFRAVCNKLFEGIVPEINKNEHGKPEFVPPYDKTFFNISHSGELVIMGVSDKTIGVDVEKFGRTQNFRGIARFFSEEEREYLSKSGQYSDEMKDWSEEGEGQNRFKENNKEEQTFYRIWTYREAFSKLMGSGLAFFGKNEVSIDYENRRVSFNEVNYHFIEQEYPLYQISLCMEEGEELNEISYFDGHGFV